MFKRFDANMLNLVMITGIVYISLAILNSL